MRCDVAMKSGVALLGLYLFVCGSANVVSAQDASLKATLQTRYADLKSAMGARDDKAVAALLSSDFESIDASGQIQNTDQMLKELDALPQDTRKVSTTELLSVTLAGKTAVVEQKYDMKTVKTAADGTSRNIELVTLSTDTWVSVNGTWLMQKTVTNQVDYYVDGKQVLHKVRATS
jgi:hypothetical protein